MIVGTDQFTRPELQVLPIGAHSGSQVSDKGADYAGSPERSRATRIATRKRCAYETLPDISTDDARRCRYRRLSNNGGLNGLV
jgi:hypothetical protein